MPLVKSRIPSPIGRSGRPVNILRRIVSHQERSYLTRHPGEYLELIKSNGTPWAEDEALSIRSAAAYTQEFHAKRRVVGKNAYRVWLSYNPEHYTQLAERKLRDK